MSVETMTLKDNTVVDRTTALTTWQILRELFVGGLDGALAASDLATACRREERPIRVTSSRTKKLQLLGLADENGIVHESVALVVRNSVIGEKMQLHLESPFQD